MKNKNKRETLVSKNGQTCSDVKAGIYSIFFKFVTFFCFYKTLCAL